MSLRPAIAATTCITFIILLMSARVAYAQEIYLTGPLANPPVCSATSDDHCAIAHFSEGQARAESPPRSASDWEPEAKTSGFDSHSDRSDRSDHSIRRGIDSPDPGAIVNERTPYLQTPRLTMRGFEGTSGQDVEVLFGNIPLNQVSNIRAPGFADMRALMPETIYDAKVWSGPYDPHQGDFALGGTVKLEPGIDRTGLVAKGTYGSFDSRRIFVGFGGPGGEWSNTFAAFAIEGTDGVASGRSADRTVFAGQIAYGQDSRMYFKGTVLISEGRLDFPGYVDQASIDRGVADPYASRSPFGLDRASQAHIGTECTWTIGNGRLRIGAYASSIKMTMRQDLTGTDNYEQVNDQTTIGLTTAYLHDLPFLSSGNRLELGTSARIDSIDQSDTKLAADYTKIIEPIDATISATNLAAYVDARFVLKHTDEDHGGAAKRERIIIHGGPRVDSLSYATTDHASPDATQRTAQGLNLGNKASIDLMIVPGLTSVTSYGEGFRSPRARTLEEGQRVPFAKLRSVETGLRLQKTNHVRASLVGFASWLSEERVFDGGATRTNASAPASSHTGIVGAMGSRWTLNSYYDNVLTTGMSATYTRAVFTDSDAQFRAGDPVPYVPRFIMRGDVEIRSKFAAHVWDNSYLWWRAGLGVEGAADTYLPASQPIHGADSFVLNAHVAIELKGVELGLIGTNLLGLRYYDAQYIYALTNAAPTRNVLVAAPTTVLASLTIHYPSKEHRNDPSWRPPME